MLRKIASLFLLGAMVACAPEDAVSADESVAQVSSAIIKGSESGDAQDFVLQIGLETDGAVIPQCSSSLIAKNLILTARHCVADLDEKTGTVSPSYEASRFTIYLGKDGPQKIANGDEPDARGKQVITQAGSSMFPDLALIVLDRDLDAPVATIRLDDSAQKKESVSVVGFGMNEYNQNVQVRMQKEEVKITALAPEVTRYHSLHAGEFAMGEAACYGDSGGPALSSETSAIVGVASRVNSGVAATEANPNAMCVGAEDVFTSLRPFRPLVEAAFKAAGKKPKIEPAQVRTASNNGAENGETQSTAYSTSAHLSASDDAGGGCSQTGTSTSSNVGTFALGLGLVLAARRRRQS